MSRHPRLVVPGYPHHITQRGNNRQLTFFDDDDRWSYIHALRHFTRKYQVEVWAYCLMPNHTHVLAVPRLGESLARGIGMTNMAYTQIFNRKYRRTGRLWQSRFFSSVVDTNEYLWAVARYIETNPVVAGLTDVAEDYGWSSARCHVEGKEDPLVEASAWLAREDRNAYRAFLIEDAEQLNHMIGQQTRSGRPIGDPEFWGTPGYEGGEGLED